MPPFFAAGNVNYARYGLYYLHSMEEIPPVVCKDFRKDQHTKHHKSGVFNRKRSGMAI
jgi:hypothetical protein